MEQQDAKDHHGKGEPRSAEQRGEDVAYTINHAFACTLTDVATPYLGHKIFTKMSHSHDSLGEWFLGEGVGDFAAVPVTVAIQNHAPRLVSAVRATMEATLGWAFRKSARREARGWATQNKVAADSPEAREKEQRIYSYEVEHLPQAAVWTATSMVFNISTQKLFHKFMHEGHDHGSKSIAKMALALTAGKLVSTGLVVGSRAAFPDKAHQWDNFASRKVFAPATKAVSKLFGINSKAAEKAEKKREQAHDSWEDRTKSEPLSSGNPAPLR